MSTKALEEALTLLESHIKACGPCAHDVNICVCGERSALEVARDELKAIRESAKTLERLHVGDYTYKVRECDHVLKETPEGESTWDHPDVTAWSKASVLLGAIAKETK